MVRTRLRVLFAVFLLLAIVGAASFVPFGRSPVLAAIEKAGQADLLDINTATDDQLKALPVFARLKPHRGSGRNVQPKPIGLLTVNSQRAIRLEEMTMRPRPESADHRNWR